MSKKNTYTADEFVTAAHTSHYRGRYEALLFFKKSKIDPTDTAVKDALIKLATTEPYSKARNIAQGLCAEFKLLDISTIQYSGVRWDVMDSQPFEDIASRAIESCTKYTTKTLSREQVIDIVNCIKGRSPKEYDTMRSLCGHFSGFEKWLQRKYAEFRKKRLEQAEAERKRANYLNPKTAKYAESWGLTVKENDAKTGYDVYEKGQRISPIGGLPPYDVRKFVAAYGKEHSYLMPRRFKGLYIPDLGGKIESIMEQFDTPQEVDVYKKAFIKQYPEAVKIITDWIKKKQREAERRKSHWGTSVSTVVVGILSSYLQTRKR